MSEYVALLSKRNRGWPWPAESWGLTPMFGEDGWCHSCGIPKHPQTGSIVLRRSGLTVVGAWMPNWQFDVVCLEAALGAELEAEFALDLRPVAWPQTSPGDAVQIVAATVGTSWYDEDELRACTTARHGRAGDSCPECGVWRWLPVPDPDLPPLRIQPPLGDVDVAASPEWFGAGKNAYRILLFRRELAERIAQASPRDFFVQDLAWH